MSAHSCTASFEPCGPGGKGIHVMNDDFLHRIRTDPPPRFIARLKARLDLQDEKSLKPVRQTWLRNAFLLTLLVASGLAAALIVTKLYRQESASPTPSAAQAFQAPVQSGNTSGLVAPQVADPKPTNPPTVNSPAAGSFHMAGPSLFLPIVQQSAQILRRTGPFVGPGFDVSDSRTAIAALCGVGDPASGKDGTGKQTIDAVIVTRRILADELKNCGLQGVTHVAEVKLGYEAVVFARSSLYSAPLLTPQDIFLALAREIPDPEHREKLVRNTHVSWNQVNSALVDERIDVSGPLANSADGSAVREIILEPGCVTALRQTVLRMADKDPDSACKNLRTDGIYHDAAVDLQGYLDANPEALAIVDYKSFWVNSGRLIAASIDGVTPTYATVSDGSYPGSRTLYLYVNSSRAAGTPRMRDFAVAILDSVGTYPGSPFMYLKDTERTKSRTACFTLSDVTL
jgi:phosphate transport system substrate-binding protein